MQENHSGHSHRKITKVIYTEESHWPFITIVSHWAYAQGNDTGQTLASYYLTDTGQLGESHLSFAKGNHTGHPNRRIKVVIYVTQENHTGLSQR